MSWKECSPNHRSTSATYDALLSMPEQSSSDASGTVAWPLTTPLGDAAVRIECGAPDDPETVVRVSRLEGALASAQISGITDVVAAYSTVVVHYDPVRVLATGASSAYQSVADWVAERASTAESVPLPQPRDVVVPVAYGGDFGPDLASVAEQHGMSVEEVIRRHFQAVYTVRAIGFSAGFPYLDGLPEELHTPRRATPRTHVPAGSVGIGGVQTGIYPLASPGGWNLIGRTPLRLFRAAATPAAFLRTGDLVRFERIGAAEFDTVARSLDPSIARSTARSSRDTVFEVLQPGLQTTVQDQGRPGHQAEGVTPGGAMDLVAARMANLLVGNAERTALLEAVLTGPRLQVMQDVVVAVTGGTVTGVPGWRPLRLAERQVLDCTRIEGGARIYIAIAGGLAADRVLGGCGTDLRAGFGGHEGRALIAGDQLGWATPSDAPRRADKQDVTRWFISPLSLVEREPKGRIRVLRGPQSEWFCDEAWSRLISETYVVSPQSNRMGIRLSGTPLKRREVREMASESVVQGAIQVPPNGQPIILAADRQTIGGYPTIACVISADRTALAQLRPGDKVRFTEVSLAEAEALLAESERNMAVLAKAIKQHD